MRAILQTEHGAHNTANSNRHRCINYLCVGSVRNHLLPRVRLLLLAMECLQLDRFSTRMPCMYSYSNLY